MEIGRVRLIAGIDMMKRVIRAHKTKTVAHVEHVSVIPRERGRAAESAAAIEITEHDTVSSTKQMCMRSQVQQHVVHVIRALCPHSDHREWYRRNELRCDGRAPAALRWSER